MKAAQLRELSPEELAQKLSGLKRELLDLRMAVAAGKLDKPHRILLARREAARVLTLINQQQERQASA
ncbi:MAG: 50S ribosomal protein L29 [Candidatus Omnitrophica bacterium]|nr:50S ribosomal protein L29 [Candidatus Omnitrophota bacterium]